jgi:hypothetical protein
MPKMPGVKLAIFFISCTTIDHRLFENLKLIDISQVFILKDAGKMKTILNNCILILMKIVYKTCDILKEKACGY